MHQGSKQGHTADAIRGIRLCKQGPTQLEPICSIWYGVAREGHEHFPFTTAKRERGTIKSIQGLQSWSTWTGPQGYFAYGALGAYYEINRLHAVRMIGVEAREHEFELISETFDSPKAVHVVDNLNGVAPVSSTITFSDSVTTTEESSVTNMRDFSKSTSVDKTHSASITVGFKAGGGLLSGAEKSFEASYGFTYGTSITKGSSSSNSPQETQATTFSETYDRTFTAIVKPAEKVKFELFYDLVEYKVDWEGQVEMAFQSNPYKFEPGESFNTTVDGVTIGSQPVKTSQVRSVILETKTLSKEAKIAELVKEAGMLDIAFKRAADDVDFRTAHNLDDSKTVIARYEQLSKRLGELDAALLAATSSAEESQPNSSIQKSAKYFLMGEVGGCDEKIASFSLPSIDRGQHCIDMGGLSSRSAADSWVKCSLDFCLHLHGSGTIIEPKGATCNNHLAYGIVSADKDSCDAIGGVTNQGDDGAIVACHVNFCEAHSSTDTGFGYVPGVECGDSSYGKIYFELGKTTCDHVGGVWKEDTETCQFDVCKVNSNEAFQI